MASKVIGIDLGTTNSCVAVMEGATPRVIAATLRWEMSISSTLVRRSGSIVRSKIIRLRNAEHQRCDNRWARSAARVELTSRHGRPS